MASVCYLTALVLLLYFSSLTFTSLALFYLIDATLLFLILWRFSVVCNDHDSSKRRAEDEVCTIIYSSMVTNPRSKKLMTILVCVRVADHSLLLINLITWEVFTSKKKDKAISCYYLDRQVTEIPLHRQSDEAENHFQSFINGPRNHG